jgi:hypothetical protein
MDAQSAAMPLLTCISQLLVGTLGEGMGPEERILSVVDILLLGIVAWGMEDTHLHQPCIWNYL